MEIRKQFNRAASYALCGLLVACGGGGGGGDAAPPSAANPPPPSTLATVGAKIFFDTSLSEPAGQGCVSCHDPNRAFTDSHPQAIASGVSEGVVAGQFGIRNAPTISYGVLAPNFNLNSEDGPLGGFFHDGRAASLTAQAEAPPLNPVEMHNPDKATYVNKIRNAPYAGELLQIWGSTLFNDVDDAYNKIAAAVAAFEKEDARFRPFTSKFDYWRANRVQLTADELEGLRLFNDPTKGNCAACHPSTGPDAATPPLFTDFTYDALGVPRNPQIPANADPDFYDLGLCNRPDITDPTICGAFKVPTLRNVAITAPYFHNGVFATLKELVTFYVTRDTNPERWFPADGNGGYVKYNDLPEQYRGNVNTAEPPYNRKPGEAPALTDAEIDLVVTFLGTLTDGYVLP
jgi:cytochrome c peroxidase